MRRVKKMKDEKINILEFKDIHIHFDEDVYCLAVWIAKSDLAKSTSTSSSHTTLTGLANKFSSLYGIDYKNPITSADVMAIFNRHGIKGNPQIYMDD